LNRIGKTYGCKTDFKVGACDLEPTAKDAGEDPMKGLMISAFAAVALLAAVATMHSRSSSVDISLGSAVMPSLLELHTAAGVDKLPLQEMEDQSLIFPTEAKRQK
jgi:hypothetical protein